jgi:hypothetical protein
LSKNQKKAEICEVNGISEINKLVGNIDENENGCKDVSSDIRQMIGKTLICI